MARKTEGFSGADLQALVYNANLEVIHDSIVAEDVVSTSDTAQEYPLEHLRFGGEIASKRLLSKAEDSALQRRVGGLCSDPTTILTGLVVASTNPVFLSEPRSEDQRKTHRETQRRKRSLVILPGYKLNLLCRSVMSLQPTSVAFCKQHGRLFRWKKLSV